MLIERAVEEKIKSALATALDGEDCVLMSSWSPVPEGAFKGETDAEAKAYVSISIVPRTHDDFSLPTVNLSGGVDISVRAELAPTMEPVETIFGKVISVIDGWHYDGSSFSTAVSTSDFFAAEIRLDGGSKVSFDRESSAWTISTTFTIRGTVSHS